MSEKLNEKIEYVKNAFKDFKNYIELEDFKSFLLFTLNAPTTIFITPSLNFGKNPNVALRYDPVKKIYFTKIQTNLFADSEIIVYYATEPLTDKLILKKDDKFFDDFLTINEKEIAFSGREKFLFIKKSRGIEVYKEQGNNIEFKIEGYFDDMESFINSIVVPFIFLLQGSSDNEPDVLSSFNIKPSLNLSNKSIYYIDCFLDKEHKTRSINYIKQDENLKITLMKDFKEISHSELFKSTFDLLLKIKSFNIPK